MEFGQFETFQNIRKDWHGGKKKTIYIYSLSTTDRLQPHVAHARSKVNLRPPQPFIGGKFPYKTPLRGCDQGSSVNCCFRELRPRGISQLCQSKKRISTSAGNRNNQFAPVLVFWWEGCVRELSLFLMSEVPL